MVQSSFVTILASCPEYGCMLRPAAPWSWASITGASHHVRNVGGEPMAIFGDRILRCSDGHLFVSSDSSRLFGSIHMGPFRKMQCPVDGKIVTCGNVREASLTPEQLA